MLRVLLYDASGHDREVALDEVDVAKLGDDQLLWVDGSREEFKRIVKLAELFGVELDDKDSHGVEIFDGNYRFTLCGKTEAESALTFFVGKSWLITMADKRPDCIEQFVEGDRGETLKGRMSATSMTAAIVLRYIDGFRRDLGRVELAVDKLDETILRSREKRTPLTTLAALRRRIAGLRSIMSEQAAVVHGLNAPELLAHVDEADRSSLAHVAHAFERLQDDVARARDTVIGSFELYASRVAQDTNQLVKALTVATVITGFVGAVAGIFGMNFGDTPVTRSGYHGFLLVAVTMIAVSIILSVIAIWRRWI